MDFGFSGVVEKFEQHWGKGVTKAVLAIVGLAVVVACLGVIWTTLFQPLIAFVAEIFPDPGTPRTRAFAKFILFVAFTLIGINIALDYVNRFLQSKLNARLLRRTQEAHRIVEATKATLAESRAALADAREHTAAAELAMDEVLEYAVANQMITEAEADELKALRNRPQSASQDGIEAA